MTITPALPIYMAGGIPYRPALSVHDDLTARAIVIENDAVRVALVALDLIGINYDDVVRIRESIAESVDVDYVLVAATHTHNGPDAVGLWAPDFFCAETPYVAYLRGRVVEAVTRAAEGVRPATIAVASGNSGTPRLSRDTREPEVIDDTLTTWQARDVETDAVIVTSVHYAAHPILIPSLNFDISGDFPYWLREALEAGAHAGDVDVEGFGGICVFFNGALAGRITPANAPQMLEGTTETPAHAAAQAYGYTLARRVRELWNSAAESVGGAASIEARSAPIEMVVENPVLNIAMRSCFVDRSIQVDHVQSEVAIVRVGPLEFFAVPGMLMPELTTADFVVPPGVDFPEAAHETTIHDLSTSEYPIVVGLANDMLGYLVPRSLWDAVPPFATSNGLAPYGEVVSPGPDAAATVMAGLAGLRN